ncbi:GerW family sporulation protein [Yeguia hominis]|uniref:GerW family sporulation protein n=1 Tax=Yeguia hominis TaxID=2763662 RepID=A0A926D7S9_9FIRM|nr:GerW family sporulation protein [Yeguia hominis]MBC8532993.1 GerW family sporulation protein [Yeguia hominis]
MSEHPIEGMMDNTLDKIKQMADSNTVVGEPITTPDGTVIIPISKVSYGFASGGSDLPAKQTQKDLFGGGAGAGVTITPVAFLTVSNGNTKLLQVDPFHSSLDRVIGMVPDLLDRVKSFLDKNKEETAEDAAVQVEKSELVSEETAAE